MRELYLTPPKLQSVLGSVAEIAGGGPGGPGGKGYAKDCDPLAYYEVVSRSKCPASDYISSRTPLLPNTST